MAFKIKILRARLSIFLMMIAFFMTTVVCAETSAEPPKSRKKDSGQTARVKIDGAAIYEAPNFDSPVLEYMDADKKILISKKLYAGVGGLGAFYKVKVHRGVYGYITDTDVEIKGRSRDKDNRNRDNETDGEENSGENNENNKRADEGSDPTVLRDFKDSKNDSEEAKFENSIYMTRYLGVVYASYNYSEVLRKTTEVGRVNMIGAKLTGPTGLMGGMPMDVGVVFTTSAPDFYDEIASSAKGYMLVGDALFTMPLYENSSFMAFFGLGLVMRYSSWEVSLKNQIGKPAIDSQEIGFGAAAEVGTAVRLGSQMLVRLDGKYYYENEKYFGFDLAFLFKY